MAVCCTILIGLGFPPLESAGLALLANTAPVAFGALGTPVIALHGVTGLDTLVLTRVVASLLTPFCIVVPFWLIWAFAGFKAMREVWPAILVSGATFGFTQLLVARLHGPWLVDISAAVISLCVFVLFLRVWKPKRILNAQREDITHLPRSSKRNHTAVVIRAAVPWLILTLFVTVWGTPRFTTLIDSLTTLRLPVAGLDRIVLRVPPVVPSPCTRGRHLHIQLAISHRQRNLCRRTRRSVRNGAASSRDSSSVLAHGRLNPFYDDHDRRSNGPRFHYALLRHGCHSRSSLRADRNSISVLWHIGWLARHRLHRFRYLRKRPFWKPCRNSRPSNSVSRLSSWLRPTRAAVSWARWSLRKVLLWLAPRRASMAVKGLSYGLSSSTVCFSLV